MELGLRGKTVLVTGGSTGIGRAIAQAFGNEGAKVVFTYHRDVQLATDPANAIRSAGGIAAPVQMSLSEPETIEHVVKYALDTFGDISVLVNNALDWSSRNQGGPFEEASSDAWIQMVRTPS